MAEWRASEESENNELVLFAFTLFHRSPAKRDNVPDEENQCFYIFLNSLL
jgi:hypothetical protein